MSGCGRNSRPRPSRSGTSCSPGVRSWRRLWRTPRSGACTGYLGTRRASSVSRSRQKTWWALRRIRGPPSGMERRCPACYYRAIMRRSAPGASARRADARGPGRPESVRPSRPGVHPREETRVITSENLQQRDVTFKPGDTVRVHYRVIEGNRERVQVFEGLCISRKGGGINETFTVRKNSFGVNVERIFPLHSPKIAKIEVASRGAVRRAKLYYIRDKVGKKARVKKAR